MYWASGPTHSVADAEQPPAGMVSRYDTVAEVMEWSYAGKSPVPAKPLQLAGFELQVNPLQVIKENGREALHTATAEFYHPTDLVARVSPEAASRFHKDQRRFPPAAYEAESLLWKGEAWRTPSPEELSLIHI